MIFHNDRVVQFCTMSYDVVWCGTMWYDAKYDAEYNAILCRAPLAWNSFLHYFKYWTKLVLEIIQQIGWYVYSLIWDSFTGRHIPSGFYSQVFVYLIGLSFEKPYLMEGLNLMQPKYDENRKNCSFRAKNYGCCGFWLKSGETNK